MNKAYTAGTTATDSTSSGPSVSAGVAVGWFDAAAGYTTGSNNAMETSNTYTQGFSADFTVPAHTSYLQYAGHRVTRAYMERYRCNPAGTGFTRIWNGSVWGPRWQEFGLLNCVSTSLC